MFAALLKAITLSFVICENVRHIVFFLLGTRRWTMTMNFSCIFLNTSNSEQHIIWLFTLFCECIDFLQVLHLPPVVPKHAG